MSGGAGLRVALLTPAFWPEVRRGGERTVWDVADGLRKAGHVPTIITSHPGAPSRGVEDGVEIVRMPRPPEGWLRRRGVIEYSTHGPLSYLALSRGDYDLAHSFFSIDALAANRWARRTGRPSVFSHLGVPDRPGLTDLLGRLPSVRSAAEGADAVTVHSRAAANAFRDWLGVEARVVYPGVDLEGFVPAPERAPDPMVFCAAAAEDPRKRVEFLARTFTHVRREHSGARLALVRPPSPELAASLTAHDGVELIEPVQDGRLLAGFYGRAWASALPSIGEAGALVVLESLACGTPVVGSDDAVIPELIDRPQIGRVHPTDDEAALAQALLEAIALARDDGTAASCRTRAEEFSTDRATQGYEAIYAEVLRSRTRQY